ncbi:MAG TPA: energy transducer TonB, partial [Candidatus Aminicenantes bacterium]|nr:energy transducer TonB [Candidatus Aminicenantes bacterium]
QLQTTPLPAKKESLRDLTVPQKAKAETPASMRYPVEKPKKEPKSKTEKKALISKPQTAASPAAQSQVQEGRPGASPGAGIGTGTGSGSGLRIGVGDGPGGDGFGFGYGTGGGSGFPYNYYLQVIMDRVSVNWFTGLVDPGVAGSFQAVVYFKIHRNGQVSDLKVETSSGLQSLDLSALRAVQNSAPFPPLPNDYDDQYLVIHLIFEHSK